jgi:hypothetical protein
VGIIEIGEIFLHIVVEDNTVLHKYFGKMFVDFFLVVEIELFDDFPQFVDFA